MKKYNAIVIVIFLILLSANIIRAAEILGIYFAPDKNADKPIIQLYDNAERYIH